MVKKIYLFLINLLIKQEQYPNKVYCFIKDKKHQYNSKVSVFYKS